MLSNSTLCLLTLLAVVSTGAAEPGPIIWRLDQTAQLGGHATTVLGAPSVAAGPAAPAVFFNGASDGLLVPANPLAGLTEFTVEVLFYPASHGPAEQRFLHVQDGPGNRALIETRVTGNTWALDTYLFSTVSQGKLALLDNTKRHPADRWTWVALVFNRGHMAHYINGVKELEGTVDFPAMTTGQVSLGVRQNKVYWFQGGIAEVRWHATALGAEQLQKR